jgi:translation initiation factor 3 subunit B
MADPSGRGRDQFVMFRGETVGVFWNNEKDQPENIVDRQQWTETFVQWSPLGTYLTSVHAQGVLLWGGASWSRLRRFAHPYVNLVAFSPNEKYMVTWSNRPISIPDSGHPALSLDDDGKNYVIWDIETSKPLRSFAQQDTPAGEEQAAKKPAKYPWPAFKWSADDKYVARLNQGTSISVYELPRMNLLDKTAIKIDGVMDFEWAPATPRREGVKTYEQLFCFWTPEIGSNPARVALMSIPSKQIVRSLNLFSVSDARLHWQSDASYICVKVDRHSKSKKSQATTLEIFRVKEKGVPVEVVDTIKDTVINFAWEPKGDRFVIITTTEPVGATAVPPKTAVSFFCPEKAKGNAVGNFKHLRTLDKKNSNAIYWSPKGRFVVIATVANQQSSDLEFFDLDFEGDKPEAEKDLTANLQLMNTSEHYGVTDVEWDPSGRYVATWASAWKHSVRHPLSPQLPSQHTNSLTADGKRLPPLRLQGRAPPRRAPREVQAVGVAPAPAHAALQGGAEADPQEPARVLARVRAGGRRAHQQRRRGRRRGPPPPAQRVVCLAREHRGGARRGARRARSAREPGGGAAQGEDSAGYGGG